MSNSLLTYYATEGYRVVKPEAIYGRGSRVASGEVLYDGGYRAVTPEEMFGGGSELVSGGDLEPFVPTLSGEPLFHILLFATLVVYLNMIYRSSGLIGHLYRDMFTTRSERNMIYQAGLLHLQRFKQVASIVGFVSLALVVLRFAESFILPSSPIYSTSIAGYAPVAAMFIVVVYVAWYYALHKILEWVSCSDAAPILSAMGYMHFVRISVVLYPLATVWLLGIDGGANFIVPLLIAVAVLMIILYLKDTILFFIDKKISILYWILYLCTAFLLPLSFVAHLLPQRL